VWGDALFYIGDGLVLNNRIMDKRNGLKLGISYSDSSFLPKNTGLYVDSCGNYGSRELPEFESYDPIVGVTAVTLQNGALDQVHLYFLGRHYRTERQRSASEFRHIFGFDAQDKQGLISALASHHEYVDRDGDFDHFRTGAARLSVSDPAQFATLEGRPATYNRHLELDIVPIEEMKRTLKPSSVEVYRQSKESGLFTGVNFAVLRSDEESMIVGGHRSENSERFMSTLMVGTHKGKHYFPICFVEAN